MTVTVTVCVCVCVCVGVGAGTGAGVDGWMDGWSERPCYRGIALGDRARASRGSNTTRARSLWLEACDKYRAAGWYRSKLCIRYSHSHSVDPWLEERRAVSNS